MDRREALSALLSTAGAGSMVSEIPEDPKPLLFVLTVKDDSFPIYFEWSKWWSELWKGTPPAPLVVLPGGYDLKAIVDLRDKQ
jgi:hypothetical protein